MGIGTGISNGQQGQPQAVPAVEDPANSNYTVTQTQEQGETYAQRTNVDSINDPALQQMMASQAWMAMTTGNSAPLVALTEPKPNSVKTSSSSSSEGGITATGSGGSSASALPASDAATYQEGLELVLADSLKKMLPGMTPKQLENLGQAFEMLMAKTKNEIISNMWEAFQKGVDENNKRSIEKSKQQDILDTDTTYHELKDDQIKYDLNNAPKPSRA